MGIQALLQTLQILPPVRHMMKCDGMSISAISHCYSTPHTGLYSTCEHRSHRSSGYCILSHHPISPPFLTTPIARFNVSTPFFIWSFLPPPSPPPISVGESRVVGELKAEQPGRVDQHLTFPHSHIHPHAGSLPYACKVDPLGSRLRRGPLYWGAMGPITLSISEQTLGTLKKTRIIFFHLAWFG